MRDKAVTLSVSKDVILSLSKDVILSVSKDVILSVSKDDHPSSYRLHYDSEIAP